MPFSTLTPADTNQIIDFLIADIIERIVEGLDNRDAEGNRVRIFLDICGFVGDYFPASEALQVMEHNAGASCTHFTFPHHDTYGPG